MSSSLHRVNWLSSSNQGSTRHNIDVTVWRKRATAPYVRATSRYLSLSSFVVAGSTLIATYQFRTFPPFDSVMQGSGRNSEPGKKGAGEPSKPTLRITACSERGGRESKSGSLTAFKFKIPRTKATKKEQKRSESCLGESRSGVYAACSNQQVCRLPLRVHPSLDGIVSLI